MCKKETEEEIIENHQTKIAYRNMEKETMEMQSNQKTKDKIAVTCPHISVFTLNVNQLNSPIKRCRLAGWIKK